MANREIRVRFAPAPTGMMHLGNVRTTLINYLFARQKKGTFILRIEDTDAQRNFDPEAQNIIEDISWLGISFDEGPKKGGPHEPYFQSKRTRIYQSHLEQLIEKQLVYPCFCTQEELEKKRERQQAFKLPPRYDRTCLHKHEQEIEKLIHKKTPFIWRLKLDHEQAITITDLAHDNITFELKNFSDIPISRQDGSFTFMFANFVDDLSMNISHVFRGEDHLTNTAGQAALYHAFDALLPLFFHMPILCNIDGKKLSKRDFGFSLRDLKDAGFTADAINNYLGIIGGSFEQEIMSLDELITTINFDHLHTTGHIKYDVEKLRWINHQWIKRYTPQTLALLCRPFLERAYRSAQDTTNEQLASILKVIQSDLVTLTDSVKLLNYYFEEPAVHKTDFLAFAQEQQLATIKDIIAAQLSNIADHQSFASSIKQQAQEHNIPLKIMFSFIRLAVTGSINGPSLHDLLLIVSNDTMVNRLTKATAIV